MDHSIVFTPASSGKLFSLNQGAHLGEEVQMNSLFRRAQENQTYPKEREDMGIYGGLLVAFFIICILFIRKLQSS